jgi:hypothetical protein
MAAAILSPISYYYHILGCNCYSIVVVIMITSAAYFYHGNSWIAVGLWLALYVQNKSLLQFGSAAGCDKKNFKNIFKRDHNRVIT